MACMAPPYQGFGAAKDILLCEEDPPSCSHKYTHYDEFTPIFETVEHGRLTRHVHLFEVDASQSRCSIDPFNNTNPDIKDNVPPVDIHIKIDCVYRSTRIVLRPSMNLTDTSAFGFLSISNCTMYWKDISLFGQSIKTLALELVNSRDEFPDGEDHYFYECVEFEEIHSRMDVEYPIVRGLGEVGTLIMMGPFWSSRHPVLLNYSWPVLAEITLEGWVMTPRQLHSPSLVAMGLPVGYETWPPNWLASPFCDWLV